MRVLFPLLALGLLGACSGERPAEPIAATEPAATPAAEPPAPAVPPDGRLLRTPEGEPYAYAPEPGRDRMDTIRGCQGMAPETRPRGSNCYGIFPEQCGADRANRHKGAVADAALRQTITGYSPNGDVRFYRHGDALIQDLRIGRLNVLLDDRERVVEADCF